MLKNLSSVLVAFSLIVVGCDRRLSLDWPSGTPIEIRESHHQYVLSPDSEDSRRLHQWFDVNRSGWSRYLATAPICGICVDVGNVQLNFLGSGVIAYMPDGMWQKSAAPSDYAFLER